MTKIDRYILGQLVGPFFFFALVFTGIIWLNRALGVVDIVIENGQPASIFVELSLLLLPKAIETSLVVAGFAAAIYATNRLYNEAELVVIMNSGYSSFHLAKPFAIFGILCFLLMATLSHFVSPTSLNKLAERQDEIKRQFLTQIIKPGEFIERDDKFTFFFGNKSTNGAISEVMIQEKGTDGGKTIYTSTKGQVVTSPDLVKLVLFDGVILNLSPKGKNISAIDFESFSFDLNQFGNQVKDREIKPRELTSPQLRDALFLSDPKGSFSANAKTEWHSRNVKSFMVVLVCVIALASLLIGGYSRAGFFYRIAGGVVLVAALNSFREAMIDYVDENNSFWGLNYLPILVTAIIVLVLLSLANSNRSIPEMLRFAVYRKDQK